MNTPSKRAVSPTPGGPEGLQLPGLFHPAAVPPVQEKLASTSAFARRARAADSTNAPTTARNKPNGKLCGRYLLSFRMFPPEPSKNHVVCNNSLGHGKPFRFFWGSVEAAVSAATKVRAIDLNRLRFG